jgi:ribosomal protein S18 acetylase RimI-like enzyme
MTTHSICLATPSDARAIAELSRDTIERGLAWSYTEDRILKAIRSRTVNVAVLHERRSLSAFGIMDYGDTTAHLVLLGVHPSRRRVGLGGQVLRWLETSAVTAGIGLVRVETRSDNEAAVAFYRRLGYTVQGIVPGYYQGRIDAVRMQKQLGVTPGGGLMTWR